MRTTKKKRILDYAASRGWTTIGEVEWKELHTSLPDISDSTMRAAGLSISQPWLGVVQHTLGDLELSLIELARVYAGRHDLRRYCREQVIAAKDRARWLSRKRQLKAEMVEWMLVWLDDPAMFEVWIALKRTQSAQTSAASPAACSSDETSCA